MRKFVVIILCILVVGLGYLVFVEFNNNQNLKSKLNDRAQVVTQNEDNRKMYESKSSELDEIKEANKDKVSKYDEVEAWNQEIIKYLD